MKILKLLCNFLGIGRFGKGWLGFLILGFRFLSMGNGFGISYYFKCFSFQEMII